MRKQLKFVNGKLFDNNNHLLYCPHNNKPCRENCAWLSKWADRFSEDKLNVYCSDVILGEMKKEE